MRPFAASRRSSVGCSTQGATSSRRGGRCAHQIRRRSEKVVLTGADNSPDVVGPRGARTVLVVSNLGSTWNDRTVCAEQKIVPGAARHPVAATRRGGANGDGAGPGRIRSAPGDRQHRSPVAPKPRPRPHRQDKHWATTERSERKFRPTVLSQAGQLRAPRTAVTNSLEQTFCALTSLTRWVSLLFDCEAGSVRR